ncbi:MAG: serine/threonine-protein kinase [Bacteroidota bacterium]
MDERWSQIRMLFREALDLAPAQWETFLQSRVEDEKIRDKVLSMLAAYDEDDTFLESPAANIGPGAPGRSTTSGLVGTRVGPYEIKRSIARGGMGVVFEALDTKLDKVVALKMMSPALVQDPSFRQRFEQEARTLARLEDPHFVRVNALIDEGPNTFIVMEYVDGVTLAQHIQKRGPLAGKDAITVGAQILQALSKAHRQGIVHRDLKPSNIMLTKNYEGRLLVKVLDFGIAKNIQPDAQQTRTVGAVGTLFYMSPEQARGLRTIDHRTDLYSLGVTLYETLCGALPFDTGVDEYTVRRQIVEGHVIPINKRLPKLDTALARVLDKALSTDPADRFDDAETMRQALMDARTQTQRSANMQPAVGQQAAQPASASKTAKRRPVPLFAGVAAVVLLLAASVFLYNQFTASPAVPETAAVQPVAGGAEAENPANLGVQLGADSLSDNDRPDNNLSLNARTNDEDITSSALENANGDAQPLDTTPAGQGGEQRNIADEVPPVERANQGSGSEDTSTLLAAADPEISPPPAEVPQEATAEAGGQEQQPVQMGELSVRALPGGRIYIDDVLQESFIHRGELEAGMHSVRIENARLGMWSCRVQVNPNLVETINVNFETGVAPVVAAEDADSGAAILGLPILIDGYQTSRTTPERVQLLTGLRQIEVSTDTYELVETVLDPGAGCFQKVGNLINVHPESVSGWSPRILLRLRKIN